MTFDDEFDVHTSCYGNRHSYGQLPNTTTVSFAFLDKLSFLRLPDRACWIGAKIK